MISVASGDYSQAEILNLDGIDAVKGCQSRLTSRIFAIKFSEASRNAVARAAISGLSLLVEICSYRDACLIARSAGSS